LLNPAQEAPNSPHITSQVAPTDDDKKAPIHKCRLG
jgi:hypothetical protein